MTGSPSDSRVPVVPDHELLRPIGRGSYGEVWLARSVLGELRAVKLVRHSGLADSGPGGREFEGLRKFEPISRAHPGLIQILHAGRFDCGFYYVMELADDAGEPAGSDQRSEVKGQGAATMGQTDVGEPAMPTVGHGSMNPASYAPRTLRSELQRRGRLPIQECLDLALKLTEALGYLHRHGLVHRDLKPSNIIFVSHEPKLADIGLVASADASISCVGTEGYLPPEGPGKPTADLYALGKVLYELATGRDRTDFPELPTLLREDPEREALSELNEVILKACEPEARRRYQTTAEMQSDLQLLKGGRSVRWTRAMSRRLALARLGGGVAAGVALLATGGFWVQRKHSREARHLQQVAEELAWRAQIEHAEDLFARGESSLALANLAQILRSHPSHAVAADRVVAALNQRSFPRLATPPLSHPSRPFAARFSPDGQTVITLARDRALRFWDAKSGRETNPAILHPGRIISVEFSPDGQRLVTACTDGKARVHDVATGAAALPPLVHEGPVSAAVFSPDARWIATTANQQLHLYDAATGTAHRKPLPHAAKVAGLGFGPDGQWLATFSEEPNVGIWETATGKLRQQLPLEGNCEHLRVSRNGQWLAVAFQHSETSAWHVHVWDLLSAAVRPMTLPHENRIYSLAFSPDHKLLAVGTANNAARVWELATGRLRFQLPHSAAVYGAEFSPDGSLILTVSVDKTARLWDASTGKTVAEAMSHRARVIQGEFSRDGERVLTASWDQTVKLWEIPDRHPVVVSLTHPARVNSVELDPSGRLALTATSRALFTASRINSWSPNDPQGVSVWEIESGRRIGEPALPPRAGIVAVRWTQSGPLALIAKQELTRQKALSADPEFSNQAQVWDVSAGAPIGGTLVHRYDITAAHFSVDGTKLAVGTTRGEVRIWDARRGSPLTDPLNHPGWINAVRFSPDGTKLVSSSAEGTAMIWDAATGRVLAGPLLHDSEVWFAQFDPSGNRVLTVTVGHNTSIWSVKGERLMDLPHVGSDRSTTNEVKPNPNWGICDPVEYGEFSPDGRLAVTVAGDRARIWDVTRGRQLSEMVHSQLVVMARFSPDGRRILTASFDGTAQLWDTATGLKLADPIRHGDSVVAVHFSADGRRSITASNDGTAMVWEPPQVSLPVPPWFPALVESIGGVRLDPNRIPVPVTWAETDHLKATLAALPSTEPLEQWARRLVGLTPGARPPGVVTPNP